MHNIFELWFASTTSVLCHIYVCVRWEKEGVRVCIKLKWLATFNLAIALYSVFPQPFEECSPYTQVKKHIRLLPNRPLVSLNAHILIHKIFEHTHFSCTNALKSCNNEPFSKLSYSKSNRNWTFSKIKIQSTTVDSIKVCSIYKHRFVCISL